MQSSLGSLTFDEKATIENKINNSDITKNSPKETIQNDINIEKSDKTFKIDVSIGSALTNSGNSVENDGSDDNKIESNHNESETNEKEGNETNQQELQKDCVIIQVNESKNEDKKQDGEITDILKDQNENFKEIKNQGENSEKNDNLNQNLNSENNLEEEEKNKKEKRENNLEGDIPTKNEEKKLEENNSKKNVLEVKENNKIEQNTEVIEAKENILEENIEGQKSGENGKEDNKLKEGDLQITINNNEELNGKKNLKLENNNLNQEIQNNDIDPIKNEENPSQSEDTQKQNNTENNENKTPGEIIIEIKGDDLEKEKKIKDKDINTINTNIENDDSDKSEDEEDEELDTSSNDLFNNRKTHYPKGIRNIGLNCYMNSLIQCLFNIEELREYFIKQLNQGKFNKKKQPICYRFAKIMRNLLYSKKAYITPIKFKKEIAKKNPLFGKNKAADATDLFRTLIDSFISELKVENKEEEEYEDYDLNDKNKIINKLKKEMKENIIYKYLNVYNLVTYICESPKHGPKNIYSYESDSNIAFNLENIIKKKNYKNYEINLEDCFEYKQQTKYNNQFYCHECNTTVTGESYEKIIIPPKILIIILNRGKGKTINNKVNFGNILDISNFIDDSQDYKNIYYELIGSCNHSGDSSPSGHYTSTCLYERKFYLFNDTQIKPLKYFKHLGEPYILFYRLKYLIDHNEGIHDIENSMVINERVLSQNEINQWGKKLIEVFRLFQFDRNNFTIEFKYTNNIFKWKIIKEGKRPLIMDFSKPTKNKRYNLLSITTIKDSDQDISEYIDIDLSYMNIYLEENTSDIYDTLNLFIKRIFQYYHVGGSKCFDKCMII